MKILSQTDVYCLNKYYIPSIFVWHIFRRLIKDPLSTIARYIFARPQSHTIVEKDGHLLIKFPSSPRTIVLIGW